MSSLKGTFIACTRCNSWVFMDDAKLSVDEQINFHQGRLPEGWIRVRGADLCPDCAKTFTELFDKFLNKA